MNLELLRSVLGWCTAINIGILLLWSVTFLAGHRWMYGFHNRLFPMTQERFNAVHYAGIAGFKLAILMFNLVPYIALRIVE